MWVYGGRKKRWRGSEERDRERRMKERIKKKKCEHRIKKLFFILALSYSAHLSIDVHCSRKLKNFKYSSIAVASFLCFGVAKIAIYLFSYIATNALIQAFHSIMRRKIQNIYFWHSYLINLAF